MKKNGELIFILPNIYGLFTNNICKNLINTDILKINKIIQNTGFFHKNLQINSAMKFFYNSLKTIHNDYFIIHLTKNKTYDQTNNIVYGCFDN